MPQKVKVEEKDGSTKLHWSQIFWKSFNAADLALSRKLAFCASPGSFRPIMMLLELSGHGIPWISGTLFVVYRAPTSSEKEVFLNLLLALLIDLVVIAMLKGTFRRSRPAYNQKDMFLTVSLDHYSFPSGHATRVAMVTVFLLTQLHMKLIIRVALVIWAFCVGISRVILGRHHVSDVFIGFLIGYFQYYWLVENLWMKWSFLKYVLSFVPLSSFLVQ